MKHSLTKHLPFPNNGIPKIVNPNLDRSGPLVKEGIKKIVKTTPNNVGVLLNLNLREIKEKIESDILLSDFFEVNNLGQIIVKQVENSNGIKGHFENMPIVPGVLLKKLFKTISGIGIVNKGYESVDFLDMVIPGQTLSVKEDGLYANDKIVMKVNYKVNPEEHRFYANTSMYNSTPNESDITITPTHIVEDEIDEFLLQTSPFRFATNCELYLENGTQINELDIIKGSYIMPSGTNYIDKNGNIDSSLFAEISAQIASLGFSYINNKDIKQDKKRKLLTFASSTTKTYPLPEEIGTEFYVECEVSDIGKNTVSMNYRLTNGNSYVLQEGTIKGNIAGINVIKRMHGTKTNSLIKD